MLDRLRKKPKTVGKQIAFNDGDFEGTSQPHNDTLVMTLRIGDFLVKRVMIIQGSGAEIMYPSLYKGLGLKSGDLRKYNAALVEFNKKIVVLEGQIKLPIVVEVKEVMVNFIMVNAFSLYTVILAWPWIHAMGAMPSTLRVKVKFPIKEGVTVMRGDQKATRQCLVTVINHKIKQKGKWSLAIKQK